MLGVFPVLFAIASADAQDTLPGQLAMADFSVSDLSQFSIEELASVNVTSVLRRGVPLNRAPASVFVITAADIARSGARTLPQVLRLAPNLDVAAVSALNYAITARGFGGGPAIANKLLVLIDNRTVYSPLFAGVFWDVQNLVLEDIERIEVISGPGGTLWGSNAVAGVINITTKHTSDTQGVFASASAGNLGYHAALRFGGTIGENGTYRIYGMGHRREHSLAPSGLANDDDWDLIQGGFRFDWETPMDSVKLQGDIYDSSVDDGEDHAGHNILLRWLRRNESGSSVYLRAFYDAADRRSTDVDFETEIFDIEGQYSLPLGNHSIVVGGGYRHIHDLFAIIGPSPPFTLDPPQYDFSIGNGFVQDTIALSEAVALTLGVKLEYSSYTEFEFLPNARIGWTIGENHFLWAAISRAVRVPSRIDRDFTIGTTILGGPQFDSEKLIAYEAGYRGQVTPDTSLSVSVFLNDYDDLRTAEFTNGGLPILITNGAEGQNYGVEIWGSHQILPWWRMRAGLSALGEDFRLKPGVVDLTDLQAPGNNPAVHGRLHSQMDLSERLQFDFMLYAVAERDDPVVPGYVEADARLGWWISDSFELSLAGRNLLHDSHPEGIDRGLANEVRRSVYVNARWTR